MLETQQRVKRPKLHYYTPAQAVVFTNNNCENINVVLRNAHRSTANIATLERSKSCVCALCMLYISLVYSISLLT